jgi:HEAT repeat protein
LTVLAALEPTPQLLDGLATAGRIRTGLAWIQALESLVDLDQARALATIRDALADPNPNTRVQALRLATRVPMDDQEDVARLRELLRDNNMFVRLETATVAVGQRTMCEG